MRSSFDAGRPALQSGVFPLREVRIVGRMDFVLDGGDPSQVETASEQMLAARPG